MQALICLSDLLPDQGRSGASQRAQRAGTATAKRVPDSRRSYPVWTRPVQVVGYVHVPRRQTGAAACLLSFGVRFPSTISDYSFANKHRSVCCRMKHTWPAFTMYSPPLLYSCPLVHLSFRPNPRQLVSGPIFSCSGPPVVSIQTRTRTSGLWCWRHREGCEPDRVARRGGRVLRNPRTSQFKISTRQQASGVR